MSPFRIVLAMKIALFGFGKMGKLVARLAEMRDHIIVHFPEEADVCIDFSAANAVIDHIQQACAAKVPLVIGTTGWEKDLPKAQELIKKSENAALFSPNFSLGMAFFQKLLKEAHHLLQEYDQAGTEWHHKEKKDAPSGTARAIHDALDIPFSSVRCGSIVGKHTIVFDSPVDSITFTHEAKNREGFALGAVRGAEWIVGKRGWFTLDDMLYCTDYAV